MNIWQRIVLFTITLLVSDLALAFSNCPIVSGYSGIPQGQYCIYTSYRKIQQIQQQRPISRSRLPVNPNDHHTAYTTCPLLNLHDTRYSTSYCRISPTLQKCVCKVFRNNQIKIQLKSLDDKNSKSN